MLRHSVIRALMACLGVRENELGAYALLCCAAAAAEFEVHGEPWEVNEVVEVFAEVTHSHVLDVRAHLAYLCCKHDLPPAQLVVKFLAERAVKLEAEIAELNNGTHKEGGTL